MVIWSEFRMGQDRDDDHREDAPHFINLEKIGPVAPGAKKIFNILV